MEQEEEEEAEKQIFKATLETDRRRWEDKVRGRTTKKDTRTIASDMDTNRREQKKGRRKGTHDHPSS